MDKKEIEETKAKWQQLTKALATHFGEEPDLQVILFLIGVQELGQGNRKFSKDEKQNLMHLATCVLLSQYGYYVYTSTDDEGWHHYELIQELPPMRLGEQDMLLRKAAVLYFERNGVI